MAKGKDKVSFEEAMQQLEGIARQLEDGELGIVEALEAYEHGTRYLKQCHEILRNAERKIALLTDVDADGNAIQQPFTEESMSLEEKQAARSRRRSEKGGAGASRASEADMDIQQGLF